MIQSYISSSLMNNYICRENMLIYGITAKRTVSTKIISINCWSCYFLAFCVYPSVPPPWCIALNYGRLQYQLMKLLIVKLLSDLQIFEHICSPTFSRTKLKKRLQLMLLKLEEKQVLLLPAVAIYRTLGEKRSFGISVLPAKMWFVFFSDLIFVSIDNMVNSKFLSLKYKNKNCVWQFYF